MQEPIVIKGIDDMTLQELKTLYNKTTIYKQELFDANFKNNMLRAQIANRINSKTWKWVRSAEE